MRFLVFFFFFITSETTGFAQPFDSAIVLNGSSNFVSIPHSSILDITDSLTLEAWIKPCDINGNKMIFTKFWCSGAQNAYYFTVFNGKLRWQWNLNICGSGGNLYESNSAVVQVNEWQHVAVVHTSSGVTLFLNGLPIAGTLIQGSNSVLKTSSEPLRIGTYRNLSGAYTLFFDGLIDEARVWNTNLSASDILNRYNGPLVGNEANLVAYYDMDCSGTGNGIVVSNGALSTGVSLNGSTVGSGSWPFFTDGLPTPNLGNDTSICQNSSYVLDVSTPGGTYLWHDNTIDSLFTVVQSDTISVELSILTGCFNSDTVVINIIDNPIVNLGNDTNLCTGQTLPLNVQSPNCTYLWQDGTTGSGYLVTQPGTLWVAVTNACTTLTDTIVVTLNNNPNVDLGNDTVLCFGQSLVLNGSTQSGSYLWQDGSTLSNFTVSQQGIYWVQVTNNCGTSSDTITIEYIDKPTVDLGKDTTLCKGQSFQLELTIVGASYLWQNGSTNPQYLVTQPGTYWVEVSHPCTTMTDAIVVSELSKPHVNLGDDTVLCNGSTLLLRAGSIHSEFLWKDSSTDSIFWVGNEGEYWVKVTNDCGFSVDTIHVFMKNCDCYVYIPNAFRPNDDQLNDYFLPETECNFDEYEFRIFDRWGVQVFETSQPNEGWDGTFQNQDAELGMYAYFLRYVNQGTTTQKVGKVFLLR